MNNLRLGTTYQRTIAALEDLKNTPESCSRGICSLIGIRIGLVRSYEINNMMMMWPKWSGSLSYPVPATDESLILGSWGDVRSQFHHFAKWQGEQRVLRLELLDFLIETCKEIELNEKRIDGATTSQITARYPSQEDGEA